MTSTLNGKLTDKALHSVASDDIAEQEQDILGHPSLTTASHEFKQNSQQTHSMHETHWSAITLS